MPDRGSVMSVCGGPVHVVVRFGFALVVCVAALSGIFRPAIAVEQQASMPPVVRVDEDGTVHVPAMQVPVSSFLSPEGKAYLAEHLKQVQRPEMLVQVDGVPPLLAGYLRRQRALFAVERQE